MTAKITLILAVVLLAVKVYQYMFQVKVKQPSQMKRKKRSFSSIKKDSVKDAEFEDIEGDKDV